MFKVGDVIYQTCTGDGIKYVVEGIHNDQVLIVSFVEGESCGRHPAHWFAKYKMSNEERIKRRKEQLCSK